MKEPTSEFVPTATHWGNYLAEVRDGVVHRLHPRDDDPDPSPIAAGMAQHHDSPVRLTSPMVRAGWLEHGPGATGHGRGRRGAEPFVEVSHDEAVRLVADELDRVRREYGNAAIFGGSYGWASAGRFHHAQSQLHRFLNAVGGYTRSVNTYSSAAVNVVLDHVVGGMVLAQQQAPTWEEIAEHGELVVAFGGLPAKNVQVNPGGLARHRSVGLQQRCRQAGVRFVNIGPIRGDVPAALEATWVPCRPNTDVAMMLGIAHTLDAEGLADHDFLERCCVGWERFARYLRGEADGQPKDARWAAAICDVDAATITGLAHDIARSRTVVTAAYALQRAHHGEQVHWMALTLSAMSGSLGRPGGGFGVSLGAFEWLGNPASPWSVASLPQGHNPVEAFIPVARIADLLLHPGERFVYDGGEHTYPEIRFVHWAGGNPFHHHQDLNRLRAAWQRPDTVVVHEPWWSPIARHADVVFPAATSLERNDIAAGRGEHTLTPMRRAVDPPAGVRTDYQVFTDLAARLGVGETFTEGRDEMAWVGRLYDQTRTRLAESGVALAGFEEFWEAGEPVELPRVARGRSMYERLRVDPVANPLPTRSGRIEISSPTIAGFGYDDCPAHPSWLEPAEWLGSSQARRYGLHLCSNQPATRLHSQYDHGETSQLGKVSGREPVVLHPDDARDRGVVDGAVVRVFNDRGACLAGARVSDELRPGVVQLATGAWYDPQDPAEEQPLEVHGNPNVLTLDIGTSSLAQGPSSNTTLVEIEPYTGPLPPVGAFTPPPVTSRPPPGPAANVSTGISAGWVNGETSYTASGS